MSKLIKDNRGQGLIELLIAIFVVVVGIVAVVTLSISTITAARESLATIEAANLAREGIEVVRNIRDSNWLAAANGAEVDWDYNLYKEDGGDFDYVGALVFDPDNGTWSLNYDATDTRLWRLPDGTYVGSNAWGGSASGFYREIRTYPICDGGSLMGTVIETGFCNPEPKIGVKIQSVITWNDKGRDRSTIAEENLYNWRQ